MSKRLYWADLIRSAAIFFVVINHNFVIPPAPITSTLIALIAFTIIKTAIPFFLMISGALLLSKNDSLKIFFKKRILKVVVPWIIWTFFFLGFNYIYYHQTFNNLGELKYAFELTFFTQLWFLPLIVGIYLLTPIWRIFVNHASANLLRYALLLWFLLTSLIPYIHQSVTFPLNGVGFFYQAFIYSGYFLLGYAITKNIIKPVALWALFALFFGSIVWTIVDYYIFKLPEKTFDYLSPNIYLCSFSLFMMIFQYYKKYTITNTPLQKLVTNISITSLGIYLLHQPITWVISPYLLGVKNNLLQLNPTFAAIFLGLFYFIISFTIVSVMQKIPKGKILLP